MPIKDSLHELILSLNRAEKRFFKIHASSSSNRTESSYMELFDLLAKQKKYDEKALLKKMNKHNVSSNFAQNKKYLKDLVIKSLCEKQEKKPVNIVNELIKESNILQQRMLYNDMFNRLKKAKAIAEKYELFQFSLTILDLEMKQLLSVDFDKALLEMETYLEAKKQILYKYNLKIELKSSLYMAYSVILKHNKKVSNEKLDFVAAHLKRYDKEKIDNLASFEISLTYYQLQECYFTLTSNFESSLQITKKILDLFEDENQHFKQKDDYRFVKAYTNYASCVFRSGNFNLLSEVLKRSEAVKLKNASIELVFFTKITSNWLAYYLNTGKLEESIILGEKFEAVYNKQTSKIKEVDLISIYYNFSLIYFFNQKYDKCLSYLARLELLNNNLRKDIFADAYLILIICHFELGNFSVIESLVRSKRNKKDIIEIEDLLTSSILKIAKNALREKEVFEDLNKKFKKLKTQHSSIDYTSLNIWLTAKQNNKSILEVYKEEINIAL